MNAEAAASTIEREPQLGRQPEQRRERLRDTLSIARVVEGADVAALAVHIMSTRALTGATHDIDGGQQLVVARPA